MFETRSRKKGFGRYQVFSPKDQRRRMNIRLQATHSVKPKKQTAPKQLSGNYKMLLYFFTVLCILIVASLSYRVFSLYTHRSFTDSSFKILIVSDAVYLARLDTSENRLTYSRLNGLSSVKVNNKLAASMQVRIPVDAILYIEKPITHINTDILHPFGIISSLFGSNRGHTDMNGFDRAKFIFLSQVADRVEEDIDWVPATDSQISTYDEKLYSLFHNKSFINNNFSVEVVNASTVSGVGSLLSQILENDGYNVVSVRSSPPAPASLTIYERSNAQALSHLQSYFHLQEVSGDKQPIVSVSLILDEEIANTISTL